MKPASRTLIVSLALLAALAGAYAWYAARSGSPELRYRLAKVERGPLQAVVVASGTLNAVTTVQVGSQISGQVKDIYADFNTPVKKDQIIARIDPATFELRVVQARADLDAAESAVALQRSALAAQHAELGRVRVNLLDAERDYERKKQLVDRNFISPAERDRAKTLLDATREQMRTVEAQIRVGEAQVNTALAAVRQRAALLKQAQVDLERTIIRAPVDGTVILRNVDAGQTVAASLQAPVLFTIARDLRDMQVEAAIDEADVGRLRVGQAADFTVDAFPRRTFSGEIRQIRKSPQTVQNVVSYTVVISAANPDLALLPGMTANVRVVVERRDSVLKVANPALRFRPPGAQDAKPAETSTGAGGPQAGLQAARQFRERLIAELKPDETLKARLDTVFDEARQKMAPLREIEDPAARRKQAERIRGQTRAKILELLTPEQRTVYERLAAELGNSSASAATGRVWLLDQGQPTPVDLRIGLSDGASTEIVSGPIQEGAEVIVGLAAAPEPRAGGGLPRRLF
jgi:HlyD family secretion protein